MPAERPQKPGAELWAWLFLHAPDLADVPPNLPPGPYGDALALANKAKFTVEELDAYQKVRDEIRQVIEIARARWLEGKIEGKIEEAARAVLTVFRVRGIAVVDPVRERILAAKDPARLQRWHERAIMAASADEVIDA